MIRRRAFSVELLEDRLVPATFGIPWQDPSHLTLSFAPDGAGIVARPSELFAALGRQFSTADWQRTILRAFQTWAVHTNLNFGFRADEGQPFGAAGLAQGDPRFGDIRVGAHEMSREVLAISVPPDPSIAGTWSGDVLLNSDYTFDGNPYSLLTVMLQEAGHALGLGNSSNTDSVMYTLYNATRNSLSSEDIARVQALYGARAADGYEGTAGNGTRATASEFDLPDGFKGETPLVSFGDITTQADVDFYTFTFPDDGNDDKDDREVTVRLQTTGTSLLAAKLTVFGQDGRVLAHRASASITGDVLQVKLTGLLSSERFYVKVEAADQDLFGVGRYGLSVRLDKTSSISDPVIEKLLRGPFDGLGADAIDAFFRNSGDVLLNPDSGDNDVVAGATPLTATPGYAAGTRFEGVASLAKKEDVDIYRLSAPQGTSRVLTATVWTADGTGFQPKVTLLDAAGNPVAAEVLVNGDGTSTVQVADTVAGQVYYLKVAVSPQAGQDKGNYFVRAAFGEQVVSLKTFAVGSLDKEDHREKSSRLYVAQTQLFHFVLTAGNEDPGASVRMTIRDAGGGMIFALTARSGETASGSSVLLRPGAYTVRFDIDNPNGPLRFVLRGGSESDPIGPVLSDPTLAPKYTTPPGQTPGQPPYYGYPGFTVPYDPALLPGYVNPQDPSTFPPGFVLPPELAHYPWIIVATDPFYWIDLGL
jgi:hypothetical protein